MELPDRFWSKVNKDGPGGCWLWTAATLGGNAPEGEYGQFAMPRGTTRYVHRLAYLALVGPIPDGMDIDHLCRVKLCLNPEHLEAVTHQENDRRKNLHLKPHCPQGHPYVESNLTPHDRSKGWRRCLVCTQAQNRRTAMRRKADRWAVALGYEAA